MKTCMCRGSETRIVKITKRKASDWWVGQCYHGQENQRKKWLDDDTFQAGAAPSQVDWNEMKVGPALYGSIYAGGSGKSTQ
jgi:hypothetical protein